MQQTESKEKEKEINSPSVGVLSEGVGAEDQLSIEETLSKGQQRSLMRPTTTLWRKGKSSLGDMMQSFGEQRVTQCCLYFDHFENCNPMLRYKCCMIQWW